MNYAHNAAGEITGITTQPSGGSAETVLTNIAWEAFGPASGFTFGNGIAETRSYDYDAVGNRTSQDEDSNTSAYAYGSTSNRLYQVTGTDAASLDYDANGNTIEQGDKVFAYNAANRLSSITLPGTPPETLTFAYSALGERVSKTSSLWATHFHYDLQGHLIAESDATGTPIREYIWLGDIPVGLIATRNAGTTPELFAVHTDHLATTLKLTDSAQQIVWQYDREPFGTLVAGGNLVKWPLRFPGQYRDDETGIYYNYFRDYDPVVGRYIESDPIGLAAGSNTYAYVGGNPLSFVDPKGLCAWDLCIGEAYVASSAVTALVTLAAGAWMASQWVDHPDGQSEWEQYKEAYRQPPPPGMDECETLRWKLKREEDLLRSRESWDSKWGAGTHSTAINQSKAAIQNLKDKISKKCKDECK